MKNENLGIKDIFVSGFALFAIFFGAGNLIIPPQLGLKAGANWGLAAIGFNVSDALLIIIGILALSKRQGSVKELGKKVSPNFGRYIEALVVLIIGPLLSIPRTGATTYEVGIKSFFPDFSPVVFAIIFFLMVYFFTINGSKVIDIVGGYLTPVLLLVLLIIILVGVFTPLPSPTKLVENQLAAGFVDGYQAMDALAALFLAGMVFSNFREKGITSEKGLAKASIQSGLIAGLGLVIVYAGLTYVGAYAHSYVDSNIGRAELLNEITYKLLGQNGKLAISSAVSFACLTTAVGVLSAFATSFSEFTKGKLSYKFLIYSGCIVSAVLSVLGVDFIMELAGPILSFLYPIIIVLYLLNLFDDGRMHHMIYKLTVGLTAIASLVDALRQLGVTSKIVEFFENVPLAEVGLGWLIFAISGLLIAKLLISIFGLKKGNLEVEY